MSREPQVGIAYLTTGACGAGRGFGLSVFLRDGDDAYRTYFTNGRGVDRLRFDMNIFDLTPLGRQEEWEDSPGGWPRTEAHFAVVQKAGPDEDIQLTMATCAFAGPVGRARIWLADQPAER